MFKYGVLFATLLVAQVAIAGYDQWIQLNIENKTSQPLRVTGELNWGKWYTNGDKHQEVDKPNFVIQPGQSARVAATGRSDSPSGTEGAVHIFTTAQKELVEVVFNVPYIGANEFKAIIKDPGNTAIYHSEWSAGGPLGEMTLKVYQF